LRGIADAVEHGQISLDGGLLPLEGPVKLIERHRSSKRKLKIELKIRLVAAPGLLAGRPATQEQPSPPPPPAPRYKQVKKRMKQDFRQLHKAAHAGTVDLEVARRFHVACRQMTSFPGKGDPHYPRLDAAADVMLQAAEAGDLTALLGVLDGLAALRKEAHHLYK